MTIAVNMPGMHPRQREVARDGTRFRVLACGRRWGKTRLGSALCLATAIDGGRAWWVAPTYQVSLVGWRLIRRMASQIPRTEIRQADRLIILPSGGEIQVRSADNPDSLRGEGLDFVVMDECAFMREEAWTEALRPALSDRQGRAMFISTPKGRNWYWRLWQRCQDPAQSEWRGWQLPTTDNPYIVPAEVEAARQALPERIFQQEYMAEFLDDAGGVFRRVVEAATAVELAEALPGRAYIAGVDVADKADWTVVSVIDAGSREQVYIDRFNRVGYEALEDRLHAVYRRFNVQTMVIEDNSVGQPVIDHLVNRDMVIVPFHTSSATKQPLIQALQSAFEHSELRILPDAVQMGELQAYEAERTATGFKYSAPPGMHDDTVMALALAWYGVAGMMPAML